MRIANPAVRKSLRGYGVLELAEQSMGRIRKRIISGLRNELAKKPDFLRLLDNALLDLIPRAAKWRGMAGALTAADALPASEEDRQKSEHLRQELERTRTRLLALTKRPGSTHATDAPVFREIRAEMESLMCWPEEDA